VGFELEERGGFFKTDFHPMLAPAGGVGVRMPPKDDHRAEQSRPDLALGAIEVVAAGLIQPQGAFALAKD
jgi:hypothetical protein